MITEKRKRRNPTIKKIKRAVNSAIDMINGLSIWNKLLFIVQSVLYTPIYMLLSLVSMACISFGYWLYKNGFNWSGKFFGK